MQAIKGDWVGQTFALATSSDSGGKKARIRRSKEDRKAMVESFIHRYQNSNNGNFPSLNLTHKEVGGSFYTVREIVREVIQENRVLGPAKLSTEEHNSFFEEYPLGSISTEPQSSAHDTTYLHQSTSEYRDLDSDDQSSKGYHVVNGNPVTFEKDDESVESSATLSVSIHDESTSQQEVLGSKSKHFDNEESITGVEAIVPHKESVELVPTDALTIHEETSVEQLQSGRGELPELGVPVEGGISQKSLTCEESGKKGQLKSLDQESLGSKKDGAEEQGVLQTGMTQNITDVVVETFPLRPVSTIRNVLDEKSGELDEITNTLEEKNIEEAGSNTLENSSVSRSEKVQETWEAVPVDKKIDMNNEKEVLETPLVSLDGSTTKEKATLDHKITDLNDSSLTLGAKFPNTPKATTGISGSPKQPRVETTSNKKRLVQHDSKSKKGNSPPTLNRINLEKWEGRSKKSTAAETNPLLGLLKTFITAFVKFWTE